MKDHPGLTWLAHYRERVNADPELEVAATGSPRHSRWPSAIAAMR
jgi:hypothetical protein